MKGTSNCLQIPYIAKEVCKFVNLMLFITLSKRLITLCVLNVETQGSD